MSQVLLDALVLLGAVIVASVLVSVIELIALLLFWSPVFSAGLPMPGGAKTFPRPEAELPEEFRTANAIFASHSPHEVLFRGRIWPLGLMHLLPVRGKLVWNGSRGKAQVSLSMFEPILLVGLVLVMALGSVEMLKDGGWGDVAIVIALTALLVLGAAVVFFLMERRQTEKVLAELDTYLERGSIAEQEPAQESVAS